MRNLLLAILLAIAIDCRAQSSVDIGIAGGKLHTYLRGHSKYNYGVGPTGILVLSSNFNLNSDDKAVYPSIMLDFTVFNINISEERKPGRYDEVSKNILSYGVIPSINYNTGDGLVHLRGGIGVSGDGNERGVSILTKPYERMHLNIPVDLYFGLRLYSIEFGLRSYIPLLSYISIASNYNKEYGNKYGIWSTLFEMRIRVAQGKDLD